MRRLPPTAHHDDEDGVSAALLLFSLFMFLAVATLAIDGAFLFLSQRGQVADTDSAALAAARAIIDEPCIDQAGVETAATGLIEANDPATDPVGVATFPARDPLICTQDTAVRVTTRRPTVSIFRGAVGFGDSDSGVRSTAQVVAPTEIGGIVPLAFCDADSHVQEWRLFVRDVRDGDRAAAVAAYNAANPPDDDHPTTDYAGARTPVHRIPFDKNFPGGNGNGSPTPNACGVEAPGNWGWVDFDGGDNGAGSCNGRGNGPQDKLCPWVVDGYEPGVTLGTPGDPTTYDCDAADAETPPDDCPGAPGFRRNLAAALEDRWQCPAATPTPDCDVLFVVLYDGGNAAGGNRAEYAFTGVMGLVLRDVGGNNANRAYLDVELVDATYSGPGGRVPAGYTGPLGVALCGAGDHEDGCFNVP